jgi:hypothetical protein
MHLFAVLLLWLGVPYQKKKNSTSLLITHSMSRLERVPSLVWLRYHPILALTIFASSTSKTEVGNPVLYAIETISVTPWP